MVPRGGTFLGAGHKTQYSGQFGRKEGSNMSTAQAVTQHLPFLRRYARALTGSQQSGDAYVTAALEALIADPTVVSLASSPRVALYKLFTTIWNSVDVNAKSEPST